MNKLILSIDPGREKTGLAILTDAKEILMHKIVESSSLILTIEQLLQEYDIAKIVMGNGTSSKEKAKQIKSHFQKQEFFLINEYRTTDEARKLYFKKNPPKGLKRLIPIGMQVPPVPIDDYAAIVIGLKFLND